MVKYILIMGCCLATPIAFSQEAAFQSIIIPVELKENAHAVVRLDETHIQLLSQRKMTIKQHRIVTVLDKLGTAKTDAYVYYDKSIKVKNIEAVVYDAFGKELKKIKQKEFKDRSVVDGVSLFTDSRLLYLDYTPITYPYTIVFTSEVETSNTAFIPKWQPVEDYYVSVEKSSYTLEYLPELNIRFKENKFEGFSIENQSTPNRLHYTALNLAALFPEDFGPSLESITPTLRVASQKFHLEGVDGEASDWNDFGKWMYANLLHDVKNLPESTKNKIKALTANEETPLDKAAAIYKYVQENTRYISVQIGIGGWKPMSAAEVDKLGYGDCKALTNYTQSLLEAAGVPSYYTIIYGSHYKENIDTEFTSLQGNHAILGIPYQGDTVFLECTSQTDPFGFQAGFTDDRDALLITPEGGKITRTKSYLNEDNRQFTRAECTLLGDGSVKADVVIASQGSRYNYRSHIETLSEEDKIKFYKEEWSYLNNLGVERSKLLNNKEKATFEEQLTLQVVGFASISGERMLFNINIFNSDTYVPERYRNRHTPVEIERGYLEEDVYTLHLPKGYEVEALPENASLSSPFGDYQLSFEKTPGGDFLYKRKLLVKKGLYPKEEYTAFRDFMKEIAKLDHSKIVLLKK